MSIIYNCQRCGYETNLKGNLKNHLKRQTICLALNEACNIDRAQLIEELEHRDYRDECVECPYCKRKFNHRSSMYRHKHICKSKNQANQAQQAQQATASGSTSPIQPNPPEQDSISTQVAPDMLERIKNEVLHELRQEFEESMRHQHVNNQNTHNNTNTNTFNIQINAFGKETTAHLTEPFLTRCVKRTNLGLIQLLDKLHYDPHVKENATVRILNKKFPLAEVRDEKGEWTYARKDKTLANMMDRGQEILQEHFDDNQEEIRESLSETMYDYIVKWFQKMEDKDKEVLEDVLTDIYVLVLNKSRELNKANAAYQTLESPLAPLTPPIPLTATPDANA